ncbi:MAG: DUF819 family protein [Psychromonas sp.]
MITQGFDFIAILFFLCGLLFWAERHYQSLLFKWFPSVILIMFSSMILYTFGLWEMTPEIKVARATVRDNAIPAMLFLMSLNFNFTLIKKLGIKLILLIIGSTITVMIGFVVVYYLMHPWLGDETVNTFGVMAAGWTGGTQNFVAIKEALNVSDSAMSYTLLMGAFCYTIWLVIIVGLKSFKPKFDRFLRSENSNIQEVINDVNNQESGDKVLTLESLMLMLGAALFVSAVSSNLGSGLANLTPLNSMVWTIIVSTIIGICFAQTKFRLISGSSEISSIMLYIVVALIGAEVNLSALLQAPIYVLCGFMILAIHATLLLLWGRVLKVDLHLVAIASIASIGSSSSATVVAATYDKNLVTIGLTMALIGSLVGSFAGLGVAYLLAM